MDQDADLIKQCTENNDLQAFNVLMGKYKDRVYNYCYAYFGNHDDADDQAQEIFIHVFEHLASFKFKSLFSSWIYRIMVNHCNNIYKSKAYRMRKNISGNITENMRMVQSDPESMIINKEKEALIYRAINSLKSSYKSILILRDVEGKSYDEIAEICKLNIGTVRSRLARARFKVAEKLKIQDVR